MLAFLASVRVSSRRTGYYGHSGVTNEFTRELQAGCCVVNDFVKSDPWLPFGGIKESGYGRKLSHYGIKEFVNIKTVCIR